MRNDQTCDQETGTLHNPVLFIVLVSVLVVIPYQKLLGGLGWGMSRAAAALLGAGTAAAYAGSSLSRCARGDGSDIEDEIEDMEAVQAQAIHDDMVATGVLPEGGTGAKQ